MNPLDMRLSDIIEKDPYLKSLPLHDIDYEEEEHLFCNQSSSYEEEEDNYKEKKDDYEKEVIKEMSRKEINHCNIQFFV